METRQFSKIDTKTGVKILRNMIIVGDKIGTQAARLQDCESNLTNSEKTHVEEVDAVSNAIASVQASRLRSSHPPFI
jgi:hypothetical protein